MEEGKVNQRGYTLCIGIGHHIGYTKARGVINDQYVRPSFTSTSMSSSPLLWSSASLGGSDTVLIYPSRLRVTSTPNNYSCKGNKLTIRQIEPQLKDWCYSCMIFMIHWTESHIKFEEGSLNVRRRGTEKRVIRICTARS